MKKLSLIIACLLVASGLFAQDCSHYLYLQNNKTIEMTGYNKKNEVTSKSVSKISDVKTSGGVTSADAATEMYDKNGKLIGSSNTNYSCNGGVISMQMHIKTNQHEKQAGDKEQGADMNIQVNREGGGGEEYPSDMKVGDHLKDYTSQMMIGNGATATVKVTDRKVLAKESVTTPAGTWDCFKISYKSSMSTALGNPNAGNKADTTDKVASFLNKLKLKMPGGNNEATIWFAPDFGMVKIETKNSRMELTAVK
ncbi:MAG TPA: hypothetical protein VGN20_23690 [Mucilaginibacter sp.]|jgi:hypothetical protein